MVNEYLKWLSGETRSAFWHDSAVPAEADDAISNGAMGMTTNPFLVNAAVRADPKTWKPVLAGVSPSLKGAEKAEEIMRRVTVFLAAKTRAIYDSTGGRQGYVCAQVNPGKPGNADLMLAQARRHAAWAPNVCVKLPCTAAGLEVLEECAAEGISVVSTVSFTVAQTLAAAERHRRGAERARKAGIKPGLGVSVLMVGRLDDYLRDIVADGRFPVAEADIVQAGTAAIKRAYAVFRERKYEAVLMPAGCRGAYHVTALAGAGMIMSIAPKIAALLAAEKPPFSEKIGEEVPADAVKRLMAVPEFVKAYEPDGMKPADFLTFGSTNRTLTQFVENGWNPLEALDVSR